tara:strand:+ start:206 stop:442 length:237 start_codon:yes stop_codon:yes gene_type:complete
MPPNAERPTQSELATESQTGSVQIRYFCPCWYLLIEGRLSISLTKMGMIRRFFNSAQELFNGLNNKFGIRKYFIDFDI